MVSGPASSHICLQQAVHAAEILEAQLADLELPIFGERPVVFRAYEAPAKVLQLIDAVEQHGGQVRRDLPR